MNQQQQPQQSARQTPRERSWTSAVASFMRRHHINAEPGEWYQIHRHGNNGLGHSSNRSKPPFWVYIIGGIVGLIIGIVVIQWLIELITAMLPWVAVAVIGLVIGKVILSK